MLCSSCCKAWFSIHYCTTANNLLYQVFIECLCRCICLCHCIADTLSCVYLCLELDSRERSINLVLEASVVAVNHRQVQRPLLRIFEACLIFLRLNHHWAEIRRLVSLQLEMLRLQTLVLTSANVLIALKIHWVVTSLLGVWMSRPIYCKLVSNMTDSCQRAWMFRKRRLLLGTCLSLNVVLWFLGNVSKAVLRIVQSACCELIIILFLLLVIS